MQYITLDKLKKHLKMDGITVDDDYIAGLGDTAEAAMALKINRTLDEVSELSQDHMTLFCHLCLMYAADLYAQREGSTSTAQHVSVAMDALAKPLRKLGPKEGGAR